MQSTGRITELHYTLGDYLLDAVQNSVEAGAARIDLEVREAEARLIVRLVDDGAGMDRDTLRRAQDPFYSDGVKHPGRRVGLGIPFLRQLAEATDGRFALESERGVGTRLELEVPRDHVDLPPFGDLPATIQQSLCFAGSYEMTVTRRRDRAEYRIGRNELTEVLGELDTVGSQALLREYIKAQEESLNDTEAEEWQK